jgi:hypothetical protein
MVAVAALLPGAVLAPSATAALPAPRRACKIATSALSTALAGMPVTRTANGRAGCSYVGESGSYLKPPPGASIDLVGVFSPTLTAARSTQAGWWTSYGVGSWQRKRLRPLGADDAIAAYTTTPGRKGSVIAFGDVRFRVGKLLVAFTVRTSTAGSPGFTMAQLAAAYPVLIKHWRSPPKGD